MKEIGVYRENYPHVKCLANISRKFPPAKITTFTVWQQHFRCVYTSYIIHTYFGPQSLCNRSFWWRFFFVVTLLFGFFCECRGVCHRTKSDLFLFLLHVLDATLSLFALVMHRQSCLPSRLTVAAPDAFCRIPGVYQFVCRNKSWHHV